MAFRTILIEFEQLEKEKEKCYLYYSGFVCFAVQLFFARRR